MPPLTEQDGVVSMEKLPKQVELVVIYPCRLTPVDSFTTKEFKHGDKVTVSREDAYEAIGVKRAVLAKTFTKEKYPAPQNKIREKIEAPPPPKK
jgi:hypothetical protein